MTDREEIDSLKAEVAVMRLFLAATATGRLPFTSKRPGAWTSGAMLTTAVGLAGLGEDPTNYATAFARVGSAILSEAAKDAAAGMGEG